MDLTSVAPATKTVALGSAAVEVSGLSLRKLTQLIIVHPDLLGLAAGKVEPTIFFNAPDMALAIFSVAVVGRARPRFWQRLQPLDDGDDLLVAFERAATGQQLEILATIVDLTFKGGERGVPFLRSVIGSLATSTTPSSKPEPEPSEVQEEDSQTSVEPTPTSSSD